jgi:hypothetical protein
MNDPDYASHFKDRTEGSVSNHYLIAGSDDLAGKADKVVSRNSILECR